MDNDQDVVKRAPKLPSNDKSHASELWEGGDTLSYGDPVLWLQRVLQEPQKIR